MTRTIALSACALAAVLSLSACGGDDQESQAASQSEQASQQPRGGGGMPGGMPGSGKVAAVDGKTAQVQSTESQTAVSWTSSTTFTRQVEGALADVSAGTCVVVTGEGADDAVTASSVRISQPTDGECTGGFGGGPGGGAGGGANGTPGEMPTDMPSDMATDVPSDMPTDRPSGGPQGGGFAVGTVTAVSADGFTVESTSRGSDETSSVTVTVEDATTYTKSVSAAAADVTVGVCVVSQGESDSTGAVTASSIAISQAVDGECTGGGPGMRPDGQDEAAQ